MGFCYGQILRETAARSLVWKTCKRMNIFKDESVQFGPFSPFDLILITVWGGGGIGHIGYVQMSRLTQLHAIDLLILLPLTLVI